MIYIEMGLILFRASPWVEGTMDHDDFAADYLHISKPVLLRGKYKAVCRLTYCYTHRV